MKLEKALITHALVTGLNDKERGFSCPVCGACAWLGDTSPDSQKFATPECQSCGYTLLFSVDVLKAKTKIQNVLTSSLCLADFSIFKRTHSGVTCLSMNLLLNESPVEKHKVAAVIAPDRDRAVGHRLIVFAFFGQRLVFSNGVDVFKRNDMIGQINRADHAVGGLNAPVFVLANGA